MNTQIGYKIVNYINGRRLSLLAPSRKSEDDNVSIPEHAVVNYQLGKLVKPTIVSSRLFAFGDTKGVDEWMGFFEDTKSQQVWKVLLNDPRQETFRMSPTTIKFNTLSFEEYWRQLNSNCTIPDTYVQIFSRSFNVLTGSSLYMLERVK